MYTWRQLLRGLRTPRVGLRELNCLYWDRIGRRRFNPGGIDIFQEDWDNLLILDGCRHDYYSQNVDSFSIEGELEYRISRGAATTEFLRGNFDGKRLHEVVYVTASTMLYQETVVREQVRVELHDTIDVWETGIEYGQDGIHPASVTTQTREAIAEYPNKRLVVHFVQPHAPYIGPKGREAFPDFKPNPLSERFHGKIDTSIQKLRELYTENLRLALGEIEPLLTDLPGRTVITADHGMLLGERERPIPIRSFGHPPRLYVEPMVTVPWHVIDSGSRKHIIPEPPVSSYRRKRSAELDERARDHLKQLGYL